MTFTEFQATKQETNDLGTTLSDALWDNEPPARGLIYLGVFFIDEVMAHWPEAARKQGKWHLLLERDEWISDNLAELEKRLYDFAISAGYDCPDIQAYYATKGDKHADRNRR
jgi:hypothetical protein